MTLVPISSKEFQYTFTCPNPPTPYYIGTGANFLSKPATFDFSPLLELGSIGRIRYFTYNYAVVSHDTSGFSSVHLQIVTPQGISWPWVEGTNLTSHTSPDYYTVFDNFDIYTDFSDQTAAVTAVETTHSNIPTVQTLLPDYSQSLYVADSPSVLPTGAIVLYSDCQGYQTDIEKFRFDLQVNFSSQSRFSSFPISFYPFFSGQTLSPTVIVKNLTAWCDAESDPCRQTGPPPPPPVGEPKAGRGVTNDVSDSRRHARAFVSASAEGTPGTIVLSLAGNNFPLSYTIFKTTLSANSLCTRWDRQSKGSPLLVLSESGSTVSLFQSTDEGKVWSSIATVGTGKHPALLVARDGRRHCFYVNAGMIQMTVYDASGAVSMPTSTVVTAGVDDDAIAADEFTLAFSVWGMTLVYVSGGTIVYQTTTDGGNTWRDPTSVAGGKHPTFFTGRDARRFYYYVSGDKILGKILDESGNIIQDEFTAISSGVDDDLISADETVLAQSKWGVELHYVHSGGIVTVTSNDGITAFN